MHAREKCEKPKTGTTKAIEACCKPKQLGSIESIEQWERQEETAVRGEDV